MAFGSREDAFREARKLLASGTEIREVAFGRASFRMTTTGWVTLGIFCVFFIVALALGRFLIPGGAIGVIFIFSTRPGRTFVVADKGIAILDRSVWSSRPRKVLGLYRHDVVQSARKRGFSYSIAVGDERIDMSGSEFKRIRKALPTPR